MFFVAVFLLPILLHASEAISACGVCGTNSGAMCVDDKTFTFCTEDGRAVSGRHSCPVGMICADDAHICVANETVPPGTPVCESKCGKCSAEARYACTSVSTFSLCFGNSQPSNIVHRCPTNTVCSITKDPTSKQFCYDPVVLKDEDISCYEPPTSSSSVFARFIAAAPKAAPAPVPVIEK